MWQLFLASLIWAFSYSFNKQTLAGTNPFVISCIFCAVSSIIFLPCLRLRAINLRIFVQIMLLGALEFGAMYVFFQSSFFFLDAYEISILLITTPIYLVLIDGILNKKPLALPCFLASICVLLSFTLFGKAEYSFNKIGIILIQCSNFSFALGQVLVKRFFQQHTNITLDQTTSILYFGGFCLCGIFALIIHQEYSPLTLNAFWNASIIGISCCGICHYLWNAGILKVKTPVVAVMNNLQIPLAILISVLFFGEKIDWGKTFICLLMLVFIICVFLFYKYKKS